MARITSLNMIVTIHSVRVFISVSSFHYVHHNKMSENSIKNSTWKKEIRIINDHSSELVKSTQMHPNDLRIKFHVCKWNKATYVHLMICSDQSLIPTHQWLMHQWLMYVLFRLDFSYLLLIYSNVLQHVVPVNTQRCITLFKLLCN